MIKYILSILIVLFFNIMSVNAQLTGTVKDSKGKVLPFAAVYIKGTTSGTFSNEDGFYKLDLNTGKNTIVYKYVGYQTKEYVIENKGVELQKNIVLQTDDVILKAVVIRADAEDPAYAIIRNAIKARENFKQKPENFKARLYQKFKLELLDAPESIMGFEIAETEDEKKNLEEMLDTNSNVVLVTETISEYFKGEKDTWKEKIISSRISGDKKGYSSMSSLFTNLDFYNNFVNFGRKMISPISSSAMLFYKFRLIGTFQDNNGNTVNKIKVIPKRTHDPVFNGVIFITEDVWNIHSLDLFTNSKNTNIRLLDSIEIKQDFKQLTSDKNSWGLLSQYATFQIGLLGFKANGYHTKNFIKYDLNQKFPENFFGSSRIKIDKESNKRDNIYWEKIRPIPLTLKEKKGYFKIDSIEKATSSKKYLDSIDIIGNKFKLRSLLLGYRHDNSFKDSYWSISSPFINLGFNPVQGIYSGTSFTYKKTKENMNLMKFKLGLTYGLDDKQILPYFRINQMIDNKHQFEYRFEIGRKYAQQAEDKKVNRLFNTVTSLSQVKNYIKLFDKKYVKLELKRHFIPGINTKLSFEYSNRSRLKNNSELKFITDRFYTPNIYENRSDIMFNRKFVINTFISFKPGTKYIDMPYEMRAIYSKYPLFYIGYNKAIALNSSHVSYDQLMVGINGYIPLGLIGNTAFDLKGSTFLSKSNVDIIDDKYFSGNQMYILNPTDYRASFHLLPFYTRSNFKSFVTMKMLHKFKGLFVGKIPLLKKLKMEEVFSFNLLQIEGERTYYEVGVGFSKILGVIDLRYSWAFKGNNYFDRGITFTYSLPISFKIDN